MEDITAAGRIDDINFDGRLVKRRPSPRLGPRTLCTTSNCRRLGPTIQQGTELIDDPGAGQQLFGKLLTHDRVIDIGQQLQATFPEGPTVENRHHSAFPGNLRSKKGRVTLQTIEVQDFRLPEQSRINVLDRQRAGRAAMPEDITVSLFIDGNKGNLAGRPFVGQQAATVDPLIDQAGRDPLPIFIRTHPPQECNRHTIARQRNQGGGNRPTALEFNLV